MKLGLEYEAARESAYNEAKRAKDYYDKGAIEKKFQVGDNRRIGMAPLNRPPPTKRHSNWAKEYRIVALKEVFVTGEDPEKEESFSLY